MFCEKIGIVLAGVAIEIKWGAIRYDWKIVGISWARASKPCNLARADTKTGCKLKGRVDAHSRISQILPNFGLGHALCDLIEVGRERYRRTDK